MSEKRVYLCGGIEGLTYEQAGKWREKAGRVLDDNEIDVYDPYARIPLEFRDKPITTEIAEAEGFLRGDEIRTQDKFRLTWCNIMLVNIDNMGRGSHIEVGRVWMTDKIKIGFSKEEKVKHPLVDTMDALYDNLDDALDFIINM